MLRTPPECEAPPEDHSQLVFAYRLLMGRRYSSRVVECRPLLQMGALTSQMGQLAGRLGTDHPGCDHRTCNPSRGPPVSVASCQ